MSRPDIERLARHYVTDPHDTCDPHEARELAQAFLDERAARVRTEEALRQTRQLLRRAWNEVGDIALANEIDAALAAVPEEEKT